ncbi:hypothetical protein QE400_000164 [Xanthomonas sacchari]|uniref:hypothetical protein n=1 Tax=Xanthomonas sacchari TaxID=56458 RepID=UPI00277FBA0F|nr:hypothetical protein [Xanthomonas sacchari]MDQ1090751.1 hypothetical protein [Xanthomonas sacchari]
MAQARDYLLCGWRVRSTLSLPELPPWLAAASADVGVDVLIEETQVPDRLDPTEPPGTWLSIGTDGSVLLQVPDLVRIHVQGGRFIRVQRLDRDDDGWRLFLLGSALGYLCLQRGLFPLHAACLRVGERTLAIAGHSGAGKSTLSAVLLQRGHRLLSDDLTVIQDDDHGITVLPAFPRLKLWHDTLHALHISSDGLPQVRQGMDKFDLRPHAGFDATPAPLDAIVLLQDAPEPRLQRCSPAAALPLLHANLARPQAAARLGLRATTFAQAAAIARQVPIWRLQRPRRFEALEATADLIESGLA